jgi:hypothetical protein
VKRPAPARGDREDAAAAHVVSIPAVISYLDATGWRREPGTWCGAGVGVWSLPEDDELELVVPLRRGFRDEAQRMREIVRTLAAVEGRRVPDVARDILNGVGDEPPASDARVRAPASGLPPCEAPAEGQKTLDPPGETAAEGGSSPGRVQNQTGQRGGAAWGAGRAAGGGERERPTPSR